MLMPLTITIEMPLFRLYAFKSNAGAARARNAATCISMLRWPITGGHREAPLTALPGASIYFDTARL